MTEPTFFAPIAHGPRRGLFIEAPNQDVLLDKTIRHIAAAERLPTYDAVARQRNLDELRRQLGGRAYRLAA